MFNYPFVSLPDYYVQLLKDNMQGIEFNANHFNSYVYENKPFLSLISLHFKDIDSDLRMDAILKAMTWKGVRNRMARLFMHYELFGKFGLNDEDMAHLNDILFWEERFSAYSVDGHSRAFLLAFYFKMASFQVQDSLNNPLKKKGIIDEDVLNLFKYCKSRVQRIDWTYVLLDHFIHFLGKKKILALLEDRLSYNEIFLLLNKKEQQEMTAGLLSYGASLFESEIFTSENILL